MTKLDCQFTGRQITDDFGFAGVFNIGVEDVEDTMRDKQEECELYIN